MAGCWLRRRCLGAIVGILVAAVLATGAGATRLGWHEINRRGASALMSFRVDSLTFGKSRWSAVVSIKNLSNRTISVGDGFGVVLFTHHGATAAKDAWAFGQADSFSPTRPAELRPGATWSGVMSGPGRPRPSKSEHWARLLFGPFGGVPGEKGPMFWVTNHSLPIPGRRPAKPGPLAA